MGSVEVFDWKEKKWVPYIPDYDKWYSHMKDVTDGYARPNRNGRYIVGSGSIHRKLAEKEREEKVRPVVKMVTPIAQAVEMAKSQIKYETEEASDPEKLRKKSATRVRKKAEIRTPENYNDPKKSKKAINAKRTHFHFDKDQLEDGRHHPRRRNFRL